VVVVGKKSNFSTRYKTFEEFLKNFKGSESYRQRIIRLHSKYPNASLSQLRGHPLKGERSISELKERPIFQRSWSELSSKEKRLRKTSLDVLSKVRRGQSLSSASRELHIKPKTVIKHTNAFKKSGRRWVAKSHDHISRVMSIYENGKEEWVEVRDSRIASKIGKYNSAVNQFLRSGNKDVLKQFKKPFKDANGKLHYFETNPDKLYEIAESREELEFYEIYKFD
jgi:hypothetical protein